VAWRRILNASSGEGRRQCLRRTVTKLFEEAVWFPGARIAPVRPPFRIGRVAEYLRPVQAGGVHHGEVIDTCKAAIGRLADTRSARPASVASFGKQHVVVSPRRQSRSARRMRLQTRQDVSIVAAVDWRTLQIDR
jgi:hypothetical protein